MAAITRFPSLEYKAGLCRWTLKRQCVGPSDAMRCRTELGMVAINWAIGEPLPFGKRQVLERACRAAAATVGLNGTGAPERACWVISPSPVRTLVT